MVSGAAAGQLRVDVSCVCDGVNLTIEVLDQEMQAYNGHRTARIEHKLAGDIPLRGMGLQIIGQLVDEYSLEATPGGENVFRLRLHVRPRS